jgi:hypothetical protein
MMVSIPWTSQWHLWTVFDRWETHPKRQADVRIIDTIILPFFKDPLFHNSMYVAEQVAGEEIDAYSSQDFSAGFYSNYGDRS